MPRTKSRKYSPAASRNVETAVKRYKQGKLKSGRGGKGGTVKSRKQAIAIGLSEARAEGKKVPRQAGSLRSATSRSSTRSRLKSRITRAGASTRKVATHRPARRAPARRTAKS